jgi:hypothetical protein
MSTPILVPTATHELKVVIQGLSLFLITSWLLKRQQLDLVILYALSYKAIHELKL